MNDKDYRKQKKRLAKLADELVKPLGFGWFTLDMQYDRQLDRTMPDTIARTYCQPEYMMATIVWYMPEVANQNDEELRHVFIHELCHILTAPLAANPNDSTKEQATELVARTIGYALQAGKETHDKK